MNSDQCAVARNYMRAAFVERRPAVPRSDFYTHLASCDACRGIFALYLADAVGVAVPPGPIGCDDCDQDIAAFIDMERAEGTQAARVAFPKLWWHLWTCPSCAETYRLTRLVLSSERLPHSDPPRRPRVQRLAYLDRAYLAGTFDYSYVTMGARRGNPGVPIVISSSEPGETPQFSLSIQRQRDGEWTLQVTMQPAPSAWLLAQLGPLEERARFGEDGHANIENVSAELLLSSDGPDLEFSLEYDE